MTPPALGRLALIVDDDALIRGLLRALLRRRGWRTLEAENGNQALEQLQQTTPDLVLLDLMMPVCNGFEVVEALRGNPAWQGLPVVIVSALDLTPEQRAQIADVVQQVLPKDQLPELMAWVQKLG